MRAPPPRVVHRMVPARGLVVAVTSAFVLSSVALGLSADVAAAREDAGRLVSFHDFQVKVPTGWRIVDLTSHPHACVRLDQPAVFLGRAGDQTQCPARLIGGAPVLQLEPLTAPAVGGLDGPLLTVPRSGDAKPLRVPSVGPVQIAVPAAGVLATMTYGSDAAGLMQSILHSSTVLAGAREGAVGAPPQDRETP